jgi:hypothetical protein
MKIQALMELGDYEYGHSVVHAIQACPPNSLNDDEQLLLSLDYAQMFR